MEFIVYYIMDAVGYNKRYEAGSKEQAIVKCVDELNREYPLSVIDIQNVEEVGGEVEKKKTKKKKEVEE